MKRLVSHPLLFVVLLSLFRAVPVFAHGDKVYPQVADGSSGGIGYRTKLGITNLGPYQAQEIKKVHVLFFHQNGTAWTIATNQGTASDFPLDLGANQTIWIETLAQSPTLTAGYAIVRNLDSMDEYPEDYEVAVTLFYEVFNGNDIIDTISVPVGQPTVKFSLPVEIDTSKNLLTGFAIVNLTNVSNTVYLYLYSEHPATNPSSGLAIYSYADTIYLKGNEQQARFISQDYFKGVTSINGMLYGESDGPIAILALLMTPTPTGPQYATMVPAYYDALRRNTYMYLPQDYPLDADIPVSDYLDNQYDAGPWDLLYETQSAISRRLTPQSGARVALMGFLDYSTFDSKTIADLQSLNYSQTPIDLSNSSGNLNPKFAFAVKTGLGRYAKIRIADVITRGGDASKQDLALEIYVFK